MDVAYAAFDKLLKEKTGDRKGYKPVRSPQQSRASSITRVGGQVALFNSKIGSGKAVGRAAGGIGKATQAQIKANQGKKEGSQKGSQKGNGKEEKKAAKGKAKGKAKTAGGDSKVVACCAVRDLSSAAAVEASRRSDPADLQRGERALDQAGRRDDHR